MFLMSFGLLSQIFIVMPQVVLELRKKPLRKEKRSSVRSKGQQSEHFMNKTTKFYLHVQGTSLYNLLICT